MSDGKASPGPERPGGETQVEFVVSEPDTAVALGSGDLPVLGTPRLLAWCEAATCALLADRLEPGSTSVGTRVLLQHRAPSAVGRRVRVDARLLEEDPPTVRFAVTATDVAEDRVVASGEVTRAVVRAKDFLARLDPGPA